MTAAAIESEVEKIMARPYSRELIRENDGTWFARVIEFPGCMTVGDTEAEALEMLNDAMRSWIEAGLEDGTAIPGPLETQDFSGKFNVRLPKTLHRDIVKRAEADGVSLNLFIVTTLAAAAGRVRPFEDLDFSVRYTDGRDTFALSEWVKRLQEQGLSADEPLVVIERRVHDGRLKAVRPPSVA